MAKKQVKYVNALIHEENKLKFKWKWKSFLREFHWKIPQKTTHEEIVETLFLISHLWKTRHFWTFISKCFEHAISLNILETMLITRFYYILVFNNFNIIYNWNALRCRYEFSAVSVATCRLCLLLLLWSWYLMSCTKFQHPLKKVLI